MLSITKQKSTLSHINVRTERHGDKPAGAVDLKFVFTESSSLLIDAHPSLRGFLYKAEERNPDQPRLDTGEADVPTVRRFGDLIQSISLKCPVKGADVIIGFGLGGASDIEMATADVTGHHVTIMEGGSCRYQLTVKATPTSDQVKKLFEVLDGEVDLTIILPEDKQGSLGV